MDPNVKYSEIYTGDFNDPSKARAAAATLYSGDVDVVFGALDAAVQGVYAAAEAGQNRWVIPEYIDSYQKAPKVVLTSAVYGLPEIAETMISDDLAGKLKRSYVFNGENDGDKWSLAPFRDHEDVIGKDNIAKLDDLSKKIKSGEVKVPNQYQIGKRGSGDKINPKDIGC